jgi:23S rRNA (uridine2552-2'-O)-methyltransferase
LERHAGALENPAESVGLGCRGPGGESPELGRRPREDAGLEGAHREVGFAVGDARVVAMPQDVHRLPQVEAAHVEGEAGMEREADGLRRRKFVDEGEGQEIQKIARVDRGIDAEHEVDSRPSPPHVRGVFDIVHDERAVVRYLDERREGQGPVLAAEGARGENEQEGSPALAAPPYQLERWRVQGQADVLLRRRAQIAEEARKPGVVGTLGESPQDLPFNRGQQFRILASHGPDDTAGRGGLSMSSYEKPDYWAQKAKREGYPARSVYKLEEIDKKFGLVRKGMRVLDIGAAPGSWSLWILKRLAGSGFLAAVDLQPLTMKPPYGNFRFIQGDLYAPAIRAELESFGPYDLVLSDAAPATTGNRLVDQGQSESIVEAVIDYALACLAPGGAMVAKIFQGGSEAELLRRLRQSFAQARGFKPEACRSESFETYLVATGFKKRG